MIAAPRIVLIAAIISCTVESTCSPNPSPQMLASPRYTKLISGNTVVATTLSTSYSLLGIGIEMPNFLIVFFASSTVCSPFAIMALYSSTVKPVSVLVGCSGTSVSVSCPLLSGVFDGAVVGSWLSVGFSSGFGSGLGSGFGSSGFC